MGSVTWERWRWILGAVALAAVVMGTAGWGALGAHCGNGTFTPGQTTSESFRCNGAGYGLLIAWLLGAGGLTAIVAVEVIRRLRDEGD